MDAIPIAAELMPYLEKALSTAPSELVFPAEDGSMMRSDVKLAAMLRRALGRAGIVTGYKHVRPNISAPRLTGSPLVHRWSKPLP